MPDPEVLVVEDSTTQAEMLRYLLKKAGYAVEVAYSGEDALALVREKPPKLVISDILMPGVDGYELTRAIKQDERLGHIPVILLTSLSDPGDVLRGLEARVDCYLTKPYDTEYLLEKVASMIAGGHGAQPALQIQGTLTDGTGVEKNSVASPPHVANLLFSTYENAVHINRKLVEAQKQLKSLNQSLEARIRERTADLISEVNQRRKAEQELLEARDQLELRVQERTAELTGLNEQLKQEILQRKKAEDLIIHHEKMRAIGELAGGVAHNFNNLLQIIMSAAQLVGFEAERAGFPQIMPHVNQIVESARFGSETVKRLQSFAGLRADFSGSDGTIFDLSATVRQALEMSAVWWKSIPEKNGIDIHVETDLEDGLFVRGAESELFEAMVNLIKNAVEALPEGGTIEIRSERVGDEVLVRITDNGIGIPPDIREKIFQPFFTTKGFQRTGMGLSGAYGIVTRHGGTLTADTEYGEGTSFLMGLPSAQPTKEVPADAPSPAKELRILLIDDQKQVVDMLAKGLAKAGHTVLTAGDGQRGLEIFSEQHVDAIVCDLGMPGMNGIETARRIREATHGSDAVRPPFILLTGWNTEEPPTEQGPEANIDLVLQKPVSVEDLLNAVSELVAASGKSTPVPHPNDHE